MTQILAVSTNWKDFPKQFAKLATAYPVRYVPFSRFTRDDVAEDTLLLIDFHKIAPGDLKMLKPFTKASESAAVGLVDMKSRAQVLQARELGVFHLVDRDDRLSNLLMKLRNVLGDYSKPDLPPGLPPKTAQTVESTSAALNLMSVAALTGAPLPVRLLAGSARDIAISLESDGLDTWLSAVQSHHSHTYCHTMMVAGHAVGFSKALGMAEQDQYLMGLGGLVHDLGKVKIPLSILDKPGRLTAQERQLVNKHPVYSREILATRREIPKAVVDMALWHHEFIDGSGYPDGLSGSQISKRVRLITIVDIYSALTEKRAYKDAVPPSKALAIMADMEGKLDAGLLRKFRSMVLNSDFGRIRRSAS